MSKEKHTPGLWEIIGATQVVKFGEDWACIAELSNPRSDSEKQHNSRAHIHERAEPWQPRFKEACANARLIAAAPMLLDLLEVLSGGGSPQPFAEAVVIWATKYGLSLPKGVSLATIRSWAIETAIAKAGTQ